MRVSITKQWLSALCVMAFVFSGCSKITSNDNTRGDMKVTNNDSVWQNEYVRIAPADMTDNMIKVIGQQWMLVTAGNECSFNMMTASWGATGCIWGKPATFIMIRDSRYTYEFIEREQAYTLCFFGEEYKRALNICGTRSGRTTDKVQETGLTPIVTPSGLMAFREARLIIECRNMFEQRMDTAHFNPTYKDETINDFYTRDQAIHQLFISEITGVWVKR